MLSRQSEPMLSFVLSYKAKCENVIVNVSLGLTIKYKVDLLTITIKYFSTACVHSYRGMQ